MNETTKVILVIAKGDCADRLIHELLDAEFRVTEFASMGGFLRQKSTTLIIGVKPERIEQALALIRAVCASDPERTEHNATIFVLDADHFDERDKAVIKLLPPLIIGDAEVAQVGAAFEAEVRDAESLGGIWDLGRTLAGQALKTRARVA